MKLSYLGIAAVLLTVGSSALASEKVLERCEGYTPAYFVEMVKIQENGHVVYQVNLQGDVTDYKSASEAKAKFDKDCILVKSWE